MYFACFHVHLRYGLTLWGGDPESITIFRLQKEVIRIIRKQADMLLGRIFFKDLNILPLLRLSRISVRLHVVKIKHGKDEI